MPFVRKELPQEVKAVVNQLAGKIDDQLMRDLNASVVIDGKSFAEVASQFLVESKITTRDIAHNTGGKGLMDLIPESLLENTLVHLKLTSIALALGCLVGFPLGILVFRSATLSRIVVYVAGLMQTVPSIALLALMIPLFGIFSLYSSDAADVPPCFDLGGLRPITKNTSPHSSSIHPLANPTRLHR